MASTGEVATSEQARSREIPVPILLNAFSVNMFESFPARASFIELTLETATHFLGCWGFVSAVGHQSTAEVLSARLDLHVEAQRANVTLRPGDLVLLAQVQLPRLAEGQVLTAEEVASIPIRFFEVVVEV